MTDDHVLLGDSAHVAVVLANAGGHHDRQRRRESRLRDAVLILNVDDGRE